MPSKRLSTIHVGKIDGDYTYDGNNGNSYYYYRSIDWVAKDIQRNNFNQDILYSFYVFMTDWKITENDADNRIKAIETNDWRSIMSIKFSRFACGIPRILLKKY